MDNYTKEELKEAFQVVSSTIKNCEKIHPKFEKGTSQHTLLKNRIKALYISKFLIADDNAIDKYTREELEQAMLPIASIISKSEKAYLKAVEGTGTYTRLKKIIKAMEISKSLIRNRINIYE